MIKLGSHVSFEAPDYFLGSVREALGYKANTLMLYTGAPQNSRRAPISKLKIEEGRDLWQSYGLSMDDIIIHLPYIINLANTLRPETFQMGKEVLAREIERTNAIGATYMVLHPGSSLTGDVDQSIRQVAEGINEVLKNYDKGVIALETMAGKGSEIGRDFQQVKDIIDLVEKKDQIAVCLDTCHIHDAGYDLTDFDSVLDDFDRIIGLDYLKVIHVNDSKNERGSHKDRHANIGEGQIGLDTIIKVVFNPRIAQIPMILETPYVNDLPPYKREIALIRNNLTAE